MNEEWRPVPGWESVYHVSSHGRVKNCTRDVRVAWGIRTIEGRIMATFENGNGYRYIFLKRGGTRIKAYVHRLVAIAFLSNPEGLEVVNHKDRDRSNNCLENLEWLTQSANIRHMYTAHGRNRIDAREAEKSEEIRAEDLPF